MRIASAQLRAERALPALAERLELSFRPSGLPGRAGELNGVVEGQRVLVRPDKPALYVEFRSSIEGLALSTASPRTHTGAPFHSGHRAFDRLFRTRAAPHPVARRLAGNTSFCEAAVAFHRKWRRHIARVDMDRAQLCVILRRRGLLRNLAYVTPAEVEGMLPEMLHVVRLLEASTAAAAPKANPF